MHKSKGFLATSCAIQCGVFKDFANFCKLLADSKGLTGVTLVGGVANNRILRRALHEKFGLNVHFSKADNSDNAYMIGLAALKYGGRNEVKFDPDWPLS